MNAVSIPNQWSLNIRGLDWLTAEKARWETIVPTLSGENKTEALDYLAAVSAELDQRRKQYDESWVPSITSKISGAFEMLGGSGGEGAQGAGGALADKLEYGAEKVGDAVKSFWVWGVVIAVILGAGALWFFVLRKR